MTGSDLSGDIFTLDFDEGKVEGDARIGGEASVKYKLDASCHGIDLEASAQAQADLRANLGFLGLVCSRAQGELFVGAGVGVEARANFDLFDKFGLSTEIEAYAEAAVAGRLAVGLALEQLVELVRDDKSIQPPIPEIACDILYAFLREVRIEAGVSGKAAVAAMGKAHFKIEGSLRDDDNAGFVIEMGTEVGVAAAAGYEFFAAVGIENPKRFFLTAGERILSELVGKARDKLPDSRADIEIFELMLPITLYGAYELGQIAHADNETKSLQDFTQPFIGNFAAQSQRYVLDKIAEIGCGALAAQLSEDAPAGVKAFVAAAKPDYDEFLEIYDSLERNLQQSPNADNDRWRGDLALTWLSLAAARTLRLGVDRLSTDDPSRLAGLGTPADSSRDKIELPSPPSAVREELNAKDTITFPDALEYFGEVDAVSLLDGTDHLQPLMNALASALGTTRRDFLQGALQGTVAGQVSYESLKGLITQTLSRDFFERFVSALSNKFEPGSEARKWFVDVAIPALALTSSFVFEQIGRTDSKALGTLRTGLSAFTTKVFVETVVHLSRLLLSHVVTNVGGGFSRLGQAVHETPPDHILVTAGVAIADVPSVLTPEELKEPWRDFVESMCGTGAAALGPDIWTQDRWNRWQALMTRLLVPVLGELTWSDYLDKDKMREHFGKLWDCKSILDRDGLEQLLRLQMEILRAELKVVFPGAARALYDYHSVVNRKEREKLKAVAADIIEEIHEAVDAAGEAVATMGELLEQVGEDLEQAIEDLADRLNQIAAFLASFDAFDQVLNAVEEDIKNLSPDWLGWDDEVHEFFVKPENRELLKKLLALEFGLLGYVGQRLANRVSGVADLFEPAENLTDLESRIRATVSYQIEERLKLLGVLWAALKTLLAFIGWTNKGKILDALGAMVGKRLLDLPFASSAAASAGVAPRSVIIIDDGEGGASTVRSALSAALELRAQRDDLQKDNDAAASELEVAQEEKILQDRRQQEFALADEVTIAFTRPHPLAEDVDANWIYGPEVPLRIVVTGIRPSEDDPDFVERILVLLNAERFTPEPSNWSYNSRTHTLALEAMLTPDNSALRTGVNVLECSVTDGSDKLASQTLMFVENTSFVLQNTIRVDVERSCFDTPGNDHRELRKEKVVLRNTGTAPIDISGWRLADRARHSYVFPEIALSPNQTIAIHTGAGTDTDTDLFWGRRRAVWNNRGDSVYVMDRLGAIHSEYQY